MGIAMKYLLYGLILAIYFNYLLAVKIAKESTDSEDDAKFDEEGSYCFRFTWLGPSFDNTSSEINMTCTEYLNDKRLEVPCRQPYVITYDSTYPDTDWMWKNVKTRSLCKPKGSEVCVKYTYSLSGVVQNATFMCAKAIVENESGVPYGCYEMQKDGYIINACMCKPKEGHKPCNNAINIQLSKVLLFTITTTLFTYWHFSSS